MPPSAVPRHRVESNKAKYFDANLPVVACRYQIMMRGKYENQGGLDARNVSRKAFLRGARKNK